MKSEWKVSSQMIGEKWVYTVFRIRDTSEVDHSGNREIFDSYISREMAELKADELNRKEVRTWLP